MSVAQVRAFKLAKYRETLAADPHAAPAFAALKLVDDTRADLETRRASLAEAGHLTAAGVFKELQPFREKHAAALKAAQERLRTAADSVMQARQPKPAAPADSQRILDHYLSQSPQRQQQLRLAAASGRDNDLAAVLIAPANRRYVELTDEVRTHIEKRFTDPTNERRDQLDVLVLANSVVDETLATLEVPE